MMRRPAAFAIARAVHAVIFLATAAYCLLAYSPFAYGQFLKPEVISWMPDFIAVHPALVWLAVLITVLTVRQKPDATEVTLAERGESTRVTLHRGGHGGCGGRTKICLARCYVIAGVAAGLALIVRPVLPSIGNTPVSFVAGMISLVPLIWLAAIDHLDSSIPTVRSSDIGRLLKTCAVASVSVWGIYAIGAPLRLRQVTGVDLPWPALLAGMTSSATLHLVAFTAIFLILAAIATLSRAGRDSGRLEYTVIVAGSAAGLAIGVYRFAFASIAFAGVDAAVAAGGIGVAVSLAWSGVARRQAAWAVEGGAPPPTALDVWLSPIVGLPNGRLRHRAMAIGFLLVLPAAAFWLVNATSGLDWNFLIQKVTVLAVWMVTFASVHMLVRLKPDTTGTSVIPVGSRFSRTLANPITVLLAVAPIVAFGIVQSANPLDARREVSDRYATVDMSFRLIHDFRGAPAGETARLYMYLKANTLVLPGRVTRASVQFAADLRLSERPPHIFLFLIDSLRRDYVSAYNPAVTFTPNIGRFAADSFVFDRAFTRYAGTGLAVPSIWAGGMLIHMLDQRPFESRNALQALLVSGGYRRVMGIDHIMRDLLPSDPAVVELDKDVPPMECDFCRTVRELERELDRSPADRRPVFSYTLPQNVHIAVASKRHVPSDRPYPGFFAPVAESIRQVDECFGEFVAFLQRTDRYDDSVIIVASDHGDSLGEEGRWGHAYFMVPEVMRIPLIVHLPARMRDRVRVDLDRVTFSTDLTPSLYALAGREPANLGPLFGSPLFVAQGRRPVDRGKESFLVASSYGAVYGVLRDNGRMLYTVDAVDSREAAYDLSTPAGVRVTVPQSAIALNRQLIADQIGQLAALNHFVPVP